MSFVKKTKKQTELMDNVKKKEKKRMKANVFVHVSKKKKSFYSATLNNAL